MIEKTDFIEIENITSSNYTYYFAPNKPLLLGKNPQVGLKDFMLWYTIPNVCDTYENNKIKVTYNGETKEIVIPDGMYDVRELSNYINRVVVLDKEVLGIDEAEPEKVLELAVDKSTFHCLLKVQDGVELDFTEGKLYELLGLEPKVYNTNTRGKNFLNITRGVDKIYVRCDLVEREFQYNLNDVLYSILPVAAPGEAIMERLDHPIEFYNCKCGFIQSLTIRITDKHNKEIYLKEPMTIKIAFKHVDD